MKNYKELVLKEFPSAIATEEKGYFKIVYTHRFGRWVLSKECETEAAAWESAAALNNLHHDFSR